METWRKLYHIMFVFLGAMVAAAVDFPFHVQVHVVLGLSALAWTMHNRSILLKMPVSARVLRTAGANLGTGLLVLMTGALMFAPLPDWMLLVDKGVHVFAVTALLTHTASIATGHDMWLTKELANPPANG